MMSGFSEITSVSLKESFCRGSPTRLGEEGGEPFLQRVSQHLMLGVYRLDIPLLMGPIIFFNDRCDDILDAFKRNVVRIIEGNMKMRSLIKRANL